MGDTDSRCSRVASCECLPVFVFAGSASARAWRAEASARCGARVRASARCSRVDVTLLASGTVLEENSKSEAFWQIINSSRWPKEKLTDITSRDFLLQHLVSHELLASRKNEIEEFSEGLKSLGLLDLLRKNREKCKILLTADESQPALTANALKDMIIGVEHRNFSERQAYEWFISYMDEEENEEFPGDSRLRSLLQFWTGWTVVPFSGLTKRLKVSFLPDDDLKSLPTASACTAVLRIPTVHSSKNRFFQAMNIALKFGRVGFPNP